MTTAREVYRVSIHPGRRTHEPTARLAKLVIDRWLRGHAGGAVIMMGPKLCSALHPFFTRAADTQRDVVIQIDTRDTVPVITEIM